MQNLLHRIQCLLSKIQYSGSKAKHPGFQNMEYRDQIEYRSILIVSHSKNFFLGILALKFVVGYVKRKLGRNMSGLH